MSKNILIGNGINIEFGGYDKYSSNAIMQRVVDNIYSKSINVLPKMECLNLKYLTYWMD